MRSLGGQFLITVFALLLSGLLYWTAAEGQAKADREEHAATSAETGTLIVRTQGLITGDGYLRFVLFDSEKSFLKQPIRAEVVEVKDRDVTWIIEDLPYGVYAVLVHHDINSNGTMERHWYGKPKEPTGVSNDAPAKFGPPKFENAKFQVESPTLTLTITVK